MKCIWLREGRAVTLDVIDIRAPSWLLWTERPRFDCVQAA